MVSVPHARPIRHRRRRPATLGVLLAASCAPNRAPDFASPGDRELVAGQPVELALSAVDPDGDAVTFGARGLPPGSRFDPPRFRWIPLASDAAPAGRMHPVTFIAQDPHGARAEARITLTVYADHTTPVFTSPRAWVLSPGEALDVILAVRDDDSTDLSYELLSSPDGAALAAAPEGARLTWIAPAESDEHVFAFVVAVSDENGETGRSVQTFHALVEPRF